MKIENDCVIFKSTSENWEKECSGKKPYTVRILSRQEAVKLSREWKTRCLRKIIIESAYPTNAGDTKKIIKKITDISDLGELLGYYFIGIAWVP